MATKTFKIGESCAGGIITVQTGTDKVTVIQKQWDYSQGSNKGSNQKNAEELDRVEVKGSEGNDARRKVENFLWDITTDYYKSQVMAFIESKVKFKNSFQW